MKIYSCVESYIARKRATGLIYRANARVIWRFARFVGNVDIASIQSHHLEQFLRRNAVSNNTWRRYVGYLSKFFIYWYAGRQITQIPSATQKPAVKSSFFPFVYSTPEIRRLLDAVPASVRSPRCHLDAETLQTILLLVYGAAMPIGLVLRLMKSDVDLERKTIRIQSKHPDLSRELPIGPDVTNLLRRYLHRPARGRFGPGNALFLTTSGKPIPYAVVRNAFNSARGFARVGRLNSSYQPRIHDLRHSFAVHSIANWQRDHLSVEKMLPLLAAYMGNMNLESFQRYLELAPSSFETQLRRLKIPRTKNSQG